MFKSFIFIGVDFEKRLDTYILTEDDFDETVFANFEFVDNIIRCYKERNLNIAANLALYVNYRLKNNDRRTKNQFGSYDPIFASIDALMYNFCRTSKEFKN